MSRKVARQRRDEGRARSMVPDWMRSMGHDIAALIPAAGKGERLGLGPKPLLRLGDCALIEILLDTLEPLVDGIYITAPKEYLEQYRELAGSRAEILIGGETRQESIEIMLRDCDAELVLVHDASMPFVSRSLCAEVLAAAARDGAAGAFLEPVLPAGYAFQGRVVSRWSRDHARLFQSPQGFSRSCLESVKASCAGKGYQSIADRVIKAGFAMTEVPGCAENIKITTPLDWLIAQKVIAPMLGIT